MKNFSKEFFVENGILNKRATTRGRKKSSEFSFWTIQETVIIACLLFSDLLACISICIWAKLDENCVITRFPEKFRLIFCLYIKIFLPPPQLLSPQPKNLPPPKNMPPPKNFPPPKIFLPPKNMPNMPISGNLYDFMKNFADKFFVELKFERTN